MTFICDLTAIMSGYLTQLEEMDYNFPDPAFALEEPNGLLAFGGDLSTPRLLASYRQGIFPWSSPHEALLWWSPDPRGVIEPAQLHVGRSLNKVIRRAGFQVTINNAFDKVMRACAAPRPTADETWISAEMISAYHQLHQLGHAHSVEIWQEGELKAGLYGIGIGQLFCGESMFNTINDGAKLAMVALCRHFARYGGKLIDCQMQNPFLATLGITEWPRGRFLSMLAQLQNQPISPHCWQPQEITL